MTRPWRVRSRGRGGDADAGWGHRGRPGSAGLGHCDALRMTDVRGRASRVAAADNPVHGPGQEPDNRDAKRERDNPAPPEDVRLGRALLVARRVRTHTTSMQDRYVECSATRRPAFVSAKVPSMPSPASWKTRARRCPKKCVTTSKR